VREGAVQLVMEALARLERGDLGLAPRSLGLPPPCFPQGFFGAIQPAAGFDHRELGLAQRTDGPIVAILRLAVPGVGEALGADGLREVSPPALARRQLLLGLLRLLYEALRAPGALLQRGGLERHRLQLREPGPPRRGAGRGLAPRAGPAPPRVLSSRATPGGPRLYRTRGPSPPPPGAFELCARAVALLELGP